MTRIREYDDKQMLGEPKCSGKEDLTEGALPAPPPILRLRGVKKSFGKSSAVCGLDLDVQRGEIVALIGPSGCGKTTALRLVSGLDSPDSGFIEMSGSDCRRTPPQRRNTGFVFQDYALFPHLSVNRNVAFGLASLPHDERKQRIDEVLELVGLSHEAHKFPSELSGGQQQRVALARALAPRPALLLLDEPLSNLDPQLRRKVRHDVVSIIRATGTAALWVTHDHDEGLIISDKVVVMKDGKAVQTGTPASVWRSPTSAWVARFIGRGDFVSGTVRSGKVRTPLGSVVAPGWPEGAAAQVLVRPEDLVFDPEGEPGTVVRRHFAGSESVYCVEIEGGPLLHCRQPAGVEIARGSPVRVRLATENLSVFP